MKNSKFYNFEKVSETIANVYIYGDITSYKWYEDDVTAWGFKQELEELGELSELNVHINSYGGETFQALAIYNLLKQNKAKINVYIDGIAASSASIIAMAGDHIVMPKTSLIMIHNCWTWVCGNAEELRKTADDMEKIAEAYKSAYLNKVNISIEKLEELLSNESYLTAEECLEMGFADEIVENKEDNSVNQYANMSILRLVNKVKENEKQQCNVAVNDETVTKIADKISKMIEQQMITKKDKVNQIKEDSWESFFNTKNKEKR